MVRTTLLLALIISLTPDTQERFNSGELKGLSKAPGEHIMNRLEGVLAMRTVSGTVFFEPDHSPLGKVLIEIRGPGASTRIWATRSDDCGYFRMKNIPQGRYVFKTTFVGHQSEFGELVVSEQAPQAASIQLKLKPGV